MPNKLKSKLKQNDFYCVKCNRRISVKKEDICVKIEKNGVPALKSSCKKCNTKLTKWIKRSSITNLRKKYGKC